MKIVEAQPQHAGQSGHGQKSRCWNAAGFNTPDCIQRYLCGPGYFGCGPIGAFTCLREQRANVLPVRNVELA